MFPIGNVASEQSGDFNWAVLAFGKLHVQFVFQSVSRDHHGRNGDRAIIFPSALPDHRQHQQGLRPTEGPRVVDASCRISCRAMLEPRLLLSPKKPPNMIGQAAR
jgi:hypothetical protein